MLRWGFVGSAIILASFVIGIPFGAIGVATSYTIAIYAILFPCLWYAGRPIGLKTSDIAAAIWRPFVAAVSAGFLAWYVSSLIGATLGACGGVLLSLLVVIGVYVLLMLSLYGSAAPFVEIGHLISRRQSRESNDSS